MVPAPAADAQGAVVGEDGLIPTLIPSLDTSLSCWKPSKRAAIVLPCGVWTHLPTPVCPLTPPHPPALLGLNMITLLIVNVFAEEAFTANSA